MTTHTTRTDPVLDPRLARQLLATAEAELAGERLKRDGVAQRLGEADRWRVSPIDTRPVPAPV